MVRHRLLDATTSGGWKISVLDALEPSKPPLLLAPARQTEGGKALSAPLPQVLEQLGRRPMGGRLEDGLEDPGPGSHARTAWAGSVSSHSYPWSSSWSASSLPPERTIRPSINTWTKSGTM